MSNRGHALGYQRILTSKVLPGGQYAAGWVSVIFACFGRKRLQPFPQTFATALANVCNLGRKRLREKGHFFGVGGNSRLLTCTDFG